MFSNDSICKCLLLITPMLISLYLDIFFQKALVYTLHTCHYILWSVQKVPGTQRLVQFTAHLHPVVKT